MEPKTCLLLLLSLSVYCCYVLVPHWGLSVFLSPAEVGFPPIGKVQIQGPAQILPQRALFDLSQLFLRYSFTQMPCVHTIPFPQVSLISI